MTAIKRGDVVSGTYVSRPLPGLEDSVKLDKTDAAAISAAFSRLKPEVVVDTAALHNVDYCETHRDEAAAVNFRGTAAVAEECARIGAKAIFVSTDYVFDGEKGGYSEDDTPTPISVYGETKLDGEKAVLQSGQGSVVVRPSVIYSWVDYRNVGVSSSGKPLNFAAWLVSQLSQGKAVNIVDDQAGSPTLADDLAGALVSLAHSDKSRGIYHTAGRTPLSRYDFSLKVAETLGFDQKLIRPIKTAGLKQAAKRPRDSSLLSERISKEIAYQMMDIGSALIEFGSQAKADLEVKRSAI